NNVFDGGTLRPVVSDVGPQRAAGRVIAAVCAAAIVGPRSPANAGLFRCSMRYWSCCCIAAWGGKGIAAKFGPLILGRTAACRPCAGVADALMANNKPHATHTPSARRPDIVVLLRRE